MNRLLFLLLILLLFGVVSCKQRKQKQPVIKSLYVQTTGCEDSCPVFTIAVQQDRKVLFRAVANNKDTGTFKSVLAQPVYDSLIFLLQQTGFARLENKYGVEQANAPTTFTTVMYDDNQIKRIADYGQQGTAELKKLYDFVFALRERQQWH